MNKPILDVMDLAVVIAGLLRRNRVVESGDTPAMRSADILAACTNRLRGADMVIPWNTLCAPALIRVGPTGVGTTGAGEWHGATVSPRLLPPVARFHGWRRG